MAAAPERVSQAVVTNMLTTAIRAQRLELLRAARSSAVKRRGDESGAFVRSSKNGFGRLSPRNHQPSNFDPREAKSLNEGGGGAFEGSDPIAERSNIRQRGAPSTSSRPSAPQSMHE